tara:strand:+ start:540 stop:1193 length:654 start_codon:yes stop_codon:yes gene_type:complete
VFGILKKKHPAAPLCDFLTQYTPQKLVVRLDRESQTSQDSREFLRLVIRGCTYTCAADFLRGGGAIVRHRLGGVKPDVIAFEALSFSIYAIREQHLPTPEDPLDDTEPEPLVDAYRDVIAMIPAHIEKFTGWRTGDLWERRILSNAKRSYREAAEAFMERLAGMSGASFPNAEYGPPSLDFGLTLELTGRVMTFALAIPHGYAEVIQTAVAEFGLDV